MQIKFLSILLLFIVWTCGTVISAQDASIDRTLAQKYFHEAGALCDQDHGRLWSISLCGPMLLVDPNSYEVVANRGDSEGHLTKKGEVYVGRLPDSVPTANTAMSWAGVKWTMIQWPLPANKYARARLMLHELFHRVQDRIGLPASNPANNHLDSLEGRILLQLEWRALREAVTHAGRERRKAIEDALIFRSRRRELFQQAAADERSLELNEGLAEYTGVRLSERTDAEMPGYLASRLDQAPARSSFVRSFAYDTGPAYGFLLDQTKANWRARLKATDDLGLLLKNALHLQLPAGLKSATEAHSRAYDGDTLRATETAREQTRQSALNAYRAKLIDGPLLIIPLTTEIQYSYDPNNLQPFGESATVYPTLKVSDAWGVLTVNGGALMIRKEARPAFVHVPAPADLTASQLHGDGWTLQLNQGWRLVAAERKGDYVLRKNP
jgi:hypothetical protein